MGNACPFRAAALCYLLRSSIAWAPPSCFKCNFIGKPGLSTHQYRRQRSNSILTKFWSKSASWEDDKLWALDSGRVMELDDVADMPLSLEFEMLCYSQCQLLQDLVSLSSAELYFRWENSGTGGLEFRPVYHFPPVDESGEDDDRGVGSSSQSPLAGLQAQSFLPGYPFVNDPSGNDMVGSSGRSRSTRDGSRGVVGWDAAAANAASRSTSSDTDNIAGSSLGGVRAVATANGGLSVPLLYGSVVVGLLVCNRYHENDVDLGGALPHDDDADGNFIGSWDPTEVSVVERVAASLAVAAALDRRAHASDAARKVQVEQLQSVVRESLHQARNPLTALRTFGKLLLRRLQAQDKEFADAENRPPRPKELPPYQDGKASTAAEEAGASTRRALPDPGAALNRELAADLLAQSDRLVALLLPMERAVTPQQSPWLLEPTSTSDSMSDQAEDGAQQAPLPPSTPPPIGLFPAADELSAVRAGGASSSAAAAAAASDDEFESEQSNVRSLPSALGDTNSANSSAGSSSTSSKDNSRSEQARYPLGGVGADVRVCFIGDILSPILRAAAAIADRDNTTFTLRCTPDIDDPNNGAAEVVNPLVGRRLGTHGAADAQMADALDELPGILADERGLQEAVSNVLDNALKYVRANEESHDTESTPAVTVVLEAHENAVAVVVRDSGRGFEESELESVFKRGFRGRASGANRPIDEVATSAKGRRSSTESRERSRRKKGRSSRTGSDNSGSVETSGDSNGNVAATAAVVAVGGSGLGLAIARDLMRAAGGDVVAANDPASGGAVVTITALRA